MDNNNTLYHHGVKGMKWGVRRYQNKDGTLTSAGRKRSKLLDGINKNKLRRSSKKKISSKKEKSSSVKNIKEMSDDELRAKINRLNLEREYVKAVTTPERVDRGRSFVMDVLEKSGKNIATQAVTYAMGTSVNKLVGKDIVNPKKGQKDK